MARSGFPRLILTFGLAATCWSMNVASPQAAECVRSYDGSSASTCQQTLAWSYDQAARAFRENIEQKGSLDRPGGPIYRYRKQNRCDNQGLCGAAAFTCPRVNGQNGFRYIALAYLETANGPQLAGAASVCEYLGRTVPLADVEAAVHEAISKRIPTPTVISAPPGKSLVNLFTIYSTTPAPEQAITFTTPVPGEVRATPEYTWNFDDGRTGNGPGTPFTETHLPSRSPGYYLGATYTTPGTKHITLTVTWRVTFRLEGVTDIPLTPIIMTATEDKQVATARAVLVN